FGLHAENLSKLPAVRLKNLASYDGMTSEFNIVRMSPQERMAVLDDFDPTGEKGALDEDLEGLDPMLPGSIRGARKVGQQKRVCSPEELDETAFAPATGGSDLVKEEKTTQTVR
ncbi:Tn3-like element Tn3 family transposase, partial [Klebsiella pneumoniae]